MSTSVYFELGSYDPYHRADWEERIGTWFAHSPDYTRAVSPAEAEFIIEPYSRQSFLNGHVFTIARDSHYHRYPEKTFAWDSGDFPTGRLPGVYCSLGKRLFQPHRHRGFCFPLRLNRLVTQRPLAEARYLFGFSGTITSPLRARLFAELAPAAAAGLAILRETSSLFMRVYDPAADVERARFVDEIAHSKFVLCPRGNGFSSIRLFEALEVGRVPVIVSDQLVLPACIDWAACSVIVPEREIAAIPQLLAAREPEWARLATHARREWERCFGPATLLPTLVAQLREIRALRRPTEAWQPLIFPPRVMRDFCVARAKSHLRRLQNLRRRVSSA